MSIRKSVASLRRLLPFPLQTTFAHPGLIHPRPVLRKGVSRRGSKCDRRVEMHEGSRSHRRVHTAAQPLLHPRPNSTTAGAVFMPLRESGGDSRQSDAGEGSTDAPHAAPAPLESPPMPVGTAPSPLPVLRKRRSLQPLTKLRIELIALKAEELTASNQSPSGLRSLYRIIALEAAHQSVALLNGRSPYRSGT